MNQDSASEDKYAKAESDAKKHNDAILKSPSKKNVVVAGPGTGKTYLFKTILAGKSKALTLTFVNALVEDLSLELCGLSEVRTLHGFARGVLKTDSDDVKMFPRLPDVISEDAKILLGEEIKFKPIFYNRDDSNKHMEFYRKRRRYYDHYGFEDIVLAAVWLLDKKNDKIPTYEQILVDEFQDFNKLEVSLIDLLASKSPILLAGDDDQALYEFKDAKKEFIRQRHSEASAGYAPFSLPYCRRCTRVIVEAANDIINAAIKNNFLNNRIKKSYQYFDHKKKDEVSDKNPKVMYARVFEGQIPWFIENQLGKIAKEEKEKFSVLIISPSTDKLLAISDAVEEKGLVTVESVDKKDEKDLGLLDGLKLLLEDKKSNLGWRIVLKSVLAKEAFESLLKQTHTDAAKKIFEIVGAKPKKEVARMLAVLRVIEKGEKINEEKFDEEEIGKLFKRLGFDPHESAKNLLRDEIVSSSRPVGNPSIRKLPIKGTTIERSKGLAAEYVFITHCDDRLLIADKDKTKITDREICKFLVAQTRAKKEFI
jgi:superfamily I DNA/RNA helicase